MPSWCTRTASSQVRRVAKAEGREEGRQKTRSEMTGKMRRKQEFVLSSPVPFKVRYHSQRAVITPAAVEKALSFHVRLSFCSFCSLFLSRRGQQSLHPLLFPILSSVFQLLLLHHPSVRLSAAPTAHPSEYTFSG